MSVRRSIGGVLDGVLCGFIAITVLTSCAPQDERLQTAQQLAEQALQSERPWEIVESLTTEVGPRLAGTAADLRAVAWAKQMLEDAGFDRVWLEPVTFPVWQRHRERAQVVTPYPQTLQITALGYSGSTYGELTADVVAFDSLDKLRDANERHINGKIVFINQRMVRARDGAGYGQTRPIRTNGVNIAKQKGAAAVLIRSVGTDSHRLPHTGSTTRSDNPIPAAALSNPDADQLERILHKHNLVTIALDIETSLQANGQSSNVVAQLDGREHPEQVLVLGAHLDSWDLGTGAIDDGAGVAIVSAAAQLIAQLPQRPKRSIRVVLFANEEQGEWGGKQYAQANKDDLHNYVLASESDFGAGAVWQFNTNQRQLAEDVKGILSMLNIPLGSDATSGGSDVQPMRELGVPVVSFRQDGTDYFDFHHTADDTLDKVNDTTLKQNVAAWAAVYYLAAESDYDFRVVDKASP